MRIRPRRLRQSKAVRSLVAETTIRPSDFLVPLFIVEGTGVKDEIPSMPGYYRYSLDRLAEELSELDALGLHSVLLFVKVPDERKDNEGVEALRSDGLMQESIRTIKETYPHFTVMSDIAMDPYSSYGHDGIVEHGEILNDATVELLCQMSVSHAAAGVSFVAPSDMMDGRIGAIRDALDGAGFDQVGIMAYSAKHASAFYGPFRDALDSAPGFGDKKTYQMDPANRIEALKEAFLDESEGADIVMVKPGLPYLDILWQVKEQSSVPVAVYQVSGEYAMIKAAAAAGWLDGEATMMEAVLSLKRAGADIIASYFAKDVCKLLS